ncbi:MAG TPA: UrcA family protein [Bradyrhizobium sp.]|uniref:UrcA family protein n=1 Tax=Bradyrhizobium sp. TaxID=376 RepID=UPI002B46298F|nr:UrcA family protein [Bradyrhizobium sp.]HKO69952.1 UrcA family protein [Bradyrhizobium sp.]
MRRSSCMLASVAAIIGGASPAFADEFRSAAVVASPSDFATASSRAGLDQRINSAAEEVCGVNAMAENESWGSLKQCRAQVRASIYVKLTRLLDHKSMQLSAR